jgi:hypothetical protein
MISIVIGTIIAFSIILLILNWPPKEFYLNRSGLFGDSFGMLNTLFSGLAFAGLIITIHLQRQELSESKAFFQKERFEESFFRLLDYYRQNLHDIRVVDHHTKEIHAGVGALNHLIKRLNVSLRPFNSLLSHGSDGYDMYCFKLFKLAYNTQFHQTRYLGTIECILDQINTSCESRQEKEHYWKLLSSQLTGFEVSYIFYTCLIAPPDNKLRILLHDSTLINHPIIKSMINKHHIYIYEHLHDIKFPTPCARKFIPFDKKQLRQIRKNLRKLGVVI